DVRKRYDLPDWDGGLARLRLIFGPWAYGRPLLSPPGTPPERVAALRAALKATLTDAQFVADTSRLNMEIQFTEPDAVAALVGDILRTPMPVVERARGLLSVQKR